MQLEPPKNGANPVGLTGPLRLGAILLIFSIAALGVLVVLDVIPRSVFADWAGKIAMAGGIIVLAALAAALVLRAGRHN